MRFVPVPAFNKSMNQIDLMRGGQAKLKSS